MLTCEEFRILAARAAADPRSVIEQLFWIATKGNPGEPPIARLVFNGPQEKLYDALMAMREAGQPPRGICLKARQPGISTECEALLLATALFVPFSNSILIAHLDDSAEKLLRKITFMIERLPPWLRPKMRQVKKDELRFEAMPCSDGEVAMGSTILVGTAAGKKIWVGMTIMAAHLSEFAKYPYPEETLLTLLPCVPATPQSLVIIESTAEIMGDCFHKQYVAAENGEAAMTAVFIPWFELPDAHMTAPRDFKLDDDEKELQRAFGLTHDQLQWRRFKLYTECSGNLEKFNREYPTTATSAFAMAGRPAFPRKPLEAMAERARKVEPERGEWTTERGFLPMRKGRMAIWRRPEAQHDYAMAADVSAGVEGGDFSCIIVFDRHREEQVAEWHGLIAPVDLAALMVRIGLYYNTAIAAPEISGGHGWSVIEELKRNFYPRLYVYTRVDKIRNAVTNWLGWETNAKTRGLMIDSMQVALAQSSVMFWSQPTIQELMEFQWIARRAEGIDHDDRSMTAMIVWRVHLESPMPETGLPPKLIFEPDKPAEPTGPPLARNVDRQVWEEVDKELQQAQQIGRHGGWQEYAQPDPEEGEGPFDGPPLLGEW